MITEHAVCALPDNHRDWRYLALKVRRRDNTDRWLIVWGAYYWDGNDWCSSMSNAAEYEACPRLMRQEVATRYGSWTVADQASEEIR